MASLACTVIRARSQPTRWWSTTRPSHEAGPRSAAAAVRIALATMPYASVHAVSTCGVNASPAKCSMRAEQRGADRVVVLGEHPELAVVAAELLQEGHELVGLVHHLHDVHERAQQPAALHLHVHREEVARRGGDAEERGVEMPPEGLGLRGDQRRSWTG